MTNSNFKPWVSSFKKFQLFICVCPIVTHWVALKGRWSWWCSTPLKCWKTWRDVSRSCVFRANSNAESQRWLPSCPNVQRQQQQTLKWLYFLFIFRHHVVSPTSLQFLLFSSPEPPAGTSTNLFKPKNGFFFQIVSIYYPINCKNFSVQFFLRIFLFRAVPESAERDVFVKNYFCL